MGNAYLAFLHSETPLIPAGDDTYVSWAGEGGQRQTDRQVDQQAGRQTNIQTYIQTGRQADRQTDSGQTADR